MITLLSVFYKEFQNRLSYSLQWHAQVSSRMEGCYNVSISINQGYDFVLLKISKIFVIILS